MDVLDRTIRQIVPNSLACQATLLKATKLDGVTLHSGVPVEMRLCPAPPNSGIRFLRTDVRAVNSEILATYENVVGTRLCSIIANREGVKVSTIEHLMAALAGCEIDNAIVELDAEELPIMDGSAAPFVDLIHRAGRVEQSLPRKAIRVLRPITVRDGPKFLKVEPSDRPIINLEIDFDCDRIGRQSLSVAMSGRAFLQGIADARTFGFLHEIETLRAAGLAQGGTLKNAVVVSDNGILNEGGLRHSDEFVRHKILDCIGDLYLAGAPILGSVSGRCSGHTLNNSLLRALLKDKKAWIWESIRNKNSVDKNIWATEPVMAPA